MRLLTLLCLALPITSAAAQSPAGLTRADTALVGELLRAENQRDATSPSFAAALAHPDARIRLLATRALGRIRDPLFPLRDSLPAAAPAPIWPEAPWRLRLRALTPKSTCEALQRAVSDSTWPVRLRAADLTGPACADRPQLLATLRTWMGQLPADASRRASGQVSWHAGAHALQALARAEPATARRALVRYALHPQWEVRRSAARAALTLADTVRLRTLAADVNGNVQEAAIDGLASLVGHDADSLYLAALGSTHAQVVRAAAIAVAGSPRKDVQGRAFDAFAVWVRRNVASARDARVALLEAAGRTAADDRPPANAYELPADAVRLALGDDVRLRVAMAPESGGGTFVVQLRGDLAPIMAAEILRLARQHYYDGTTWHRVEHDFVIQGGSPDANEYVGFDHYLRDELGTVAHPRGTVGMSTRGHDTGDAQWFVNLRDNARLRRDYTVFGQVIAGIDVVDGVMEGDRISQIALEPKGTGTNR